MNLPISSWIDELWTSIAALGLWTNMCIIVLFMAVDIAVGLALHILLGSFMAACSGGWLVLPGARGSLSCSRWV